MRTATVAIETIVMQCPACQEFIDAPNGSNFWAEDEHEFAPRVLECPCGERVKKPTWPQRSRRAVQR